jgi:hypothetical protein
MIFLPRYNSGAGNALFNAGSKYSAILGVLLVLTSCATIEPREPWPDGAAPRENFVRHFRGDRQNQQLQTEAEYLSWVRRFYLGNGFAPGWLAITEQVKKARGGDHREQVARQLYELGERIASEWARDNSLRLINTRSTAIWGQAAQEAARHRDLENFLPLMARDVDALLAGRIRCSDISFARYYAYDSIPF